MLKSMYRYLRYLGRRKSSLILVCKKSRSAINPSWKPYLTHRYLSIPWCFFLVPHANSNKVSYLP